MTSRKDNLLAVGGLLAIGCAVIVTFHPTLGMPLALDDLESIEQVSSFSGWTDVLKPDVYCYFRPIKNLFFYAGWNLRWNPTGYHLATLAFYLAAMTGVFVLARRLANNTFTALAATAIWVFSAPNATVATWTSCFNISLATMAATYGLAAYDHWREHPKSRFCAATFFLLFAIGLLSYESAIAIAPLAVLVDLFRGRTLRNRSSVLRYAAIGAVALIWLIARHQASAITEVPIQANLNFSPGITKAQIAASAPYFLATHLVMWLSPWNHHACLASYLWDRSIPAMILPFCWTASLLCMVLGIRFWKPGNLILFGLFWFLVASFPSGNFVPMANTPYANYYLCLPSVGLALALAQILGLLVSLFRKNTEHPRLRIFSFAAIALIVFWRVSATAVTHSWMHLWRNPVLVLLETAKDRPLQYHATAKASRLLLLMGQTDPARQLANQSIRDEPSTDLPYIILGQIAYEQKKYGEARKYFRKAIVARHYSAKVLRFAQLFLAKTMAESGGDVDEAWFYLLPLLKAHDYEYHADAVLTAATLFRNNNRPDDEIRTLEKGLSYHPDNQKLRKALNDAEKRIRDQPQQ